MRHIRIVNNTYLGKDTKIYLIDDKNQEVDISFLFSRIEIEISTDAIVTAYLTAPRVTVDVAAKLDSDPAGTINEAYLGYAASVGQPHLTEGEKRNAFNRTVPGAEERD
jgi:hypothetical protein